MGALVVDSLTRGCTLSPCTGRLQWRPVTGGRTMACKCTVGVLYFSSCRSLSWLWAWLLGSGEGGERLWQLACYTCPATETSVTSGAGLCLQWEWWGEGSRERLRLLVWYMWDNPWKNLQSVYCNCADHWFHEWWNMPRFSSEQVSKPQLLLLYVC